MTTKSRPVRFVHEGIAGYVDQWGFVRWATACFQIEAALPPLRSSIEKARKSQPAPPDKCRCGCDYCG